MCMSISTRPARPGLQVGGQPGQLTKRPGGQGSLHALIELVRPQPTVPHRLAQHVYNTIPVRIRRPYLWKVRGHVIPCPRADSHPRPSLDPRPRRALGEADLSAAAQMRS